MQRFRARSERTTLAERKRAEKNPVERKTKWSHKNQERKARQGDSQLGAVSETANPQLAHTDVTGTVVDIVSSSVGDRDVKSKRHAAPERSADRRSENTRANEKKARAGHRRNIRRSNTNG